MTDFFFPGTDNPRMVRLLRAFLEGPLTRKRVDSISGASNGPDLIRRMRIELGLEIEGRRLRSVDPDGRIVCHGVYWIVPEHRRIVRAWLEKLDVIVLGHHLADNLIDCTPEQGVELVRRIREEKREQKSNPEGA